MRHLEVLEFIRCREITLAKLAFLCQYLEQEQIQTNVAGSTEGRRKI